MKILTDIYGSPDSKITAAILIRNRYKHLPDLLYERLSLRGSLWIRTSDENVDYLKIECDNVFGKFNFVTHLVIPYDEIPFYDQFEINHEFILVYAKNKALWRPNLLRRERKSKYRNDDNDSRGEWFCDTLLSRNYYQSCDYPIRSPRGKVFRPPANRSWVVTKEVYEHLLADNRIWFGTSGNARPMRKRFLSEVQQGFVSKTIWTVDENPLEKILQLATDQNSTVLVL